ncbi:MAG: dimethyl sulfoxide reductase subunit A, partial [Duodenibacillus sp.]|nr:dimethyl sulfoxide reductase subunit A [Duodenibacillus sp.]
LLPDTLGPETDDIAARGGSHGDVAGLLAIQKCVEPQWEQKPTWEICRLIARELGLEEAYTEGLSQTDWVRRCYEATAAKYPQLPSFEEFWRKGYAMLWGLRKDPVALAGFRADPAAHPLKTPSGKIEIYSERLAAETADWILPEGDAVSPVPVFRRTWDMPGDPLAARYPLQCIGIHGHGRIHSTFANLPGLRSLHPDAVLINPVDAAARGIEDGDPCEVFNGRGAVRVPARVTPRIMPGVCAIPQGAWRRSEVIGGRAVDAGGCVNTLTSHRPSPYAKGNSQHNALVEVRKAA